MFRNRKMKWLLVALVLSLVAIILVAGCKGAAPTSGPAPTVTVTTTATVTATPKPAEAEFKWKLASSYPKGSSQFDLIEIWADMVEYYSNGRIKFDRFYGGALGGAREISDGVKAGDIAAGWTWPYTSISTKFTANSLVGGPSSREALLRLTQPEYNGILYRIAQEAWAEFGGKQTVWFPAVTYYIMTVDKPVKTPADLTGLKLRVKDSKLEVGAIAAMGALPTVIAREEVYSALKTKTIHGNTVADFTSISDNKFWEVCKYLNRIPWCIDNAPHAMSLKLYNALPADLKAVVDKASLMTNQLWASRTYSQFEEQERLIREKGMTFVELTPAEQKAFIDKMNPEKLWEDFVKPAIGDKWYAEWKSEILRMRQTYG